MISIFVIINQTNIRKVIKITKIQNARLFIIMNNYLNLIKIIQKNLKKLINVMILLFLQKLKIKNLFLFGNMNYDILNSLIT